MTGTLPIRERSVRMKANTPEVVGRSAPQLPLDGMKRLKASRRFMVRLERRERELDRQRDGCHMPERH